MKVKLSQELIIQRWSESKDEWVDLFINIVSVDYGRKLKVRYEHLYPDIKHRLIDRTVEEEVIE